MTAKLVGFDGTDRTITLECDLMPLCAVGDIWIAHSETDRCTWAQDEDGNFDTGCGRTMCGMENGASPAEHDMAFCPCCGRLMMVEPYDEKEEA